MTTELGIRHVVYRGHGESSEVVNFVAPNPADHASLLAIMSRDLVCAGPDLAIAVVVHLVIERHVGCLPIVDVNHRPIGVITKYDLVEELDAAMQASTCGCQVPSDLKAETAEDVMMPLALTLGEHATITQAAQLMTSEGMHHVLVVDANQVLVGIVSSNDIVRWVSKRGGVVARTAVGSPIWHPLES